MHDFSISQQMATQVIKKAHEGRASDVLEVRIKIGELTHLNPEQISFWLKQLFKGTLAQTAKITVEKMPLVIECRECHYQGPAEKEKVGEDDLYYFPFSPSFRCPVCESSEVELKAGKECVLEKIKIKRGG